MRRGVVLFAALLLAVVPGHLAADDSDVRMEMSRWLAGAYNAPAKCRYVCQGDEMPTKPTVNSLTDMPERYTCWGLFKMWCGAPPSEGESKAEQLSGSFCQGHFKSMMFSPPSHPGSKAAFVSCEGGHAWISRRTATCPHTGKRWKKMMGTMGAGDSMSGMMFPERPSDAPASFASLLRPDAASDPVEASAMLATLNSDKELSAVTAGLREDMKNAAPVPGEGTFGLESRAEGFSVDYKATKEVPPSDSPEQPLSLDSPEVWDSLNEDAKSVLGSSWLDWVPHFSGSSEGGHREEGGERPSVMCNGKPAWMHGAFPCMGNFSVTGTRSSPSTSSSSKGCGSDKSSSTSAKMPRVLKAVEASSSAGSSKLILPGQTLNTQKEVKDAPAWSQSMEAECDGFWGGLLRHCWGVTTSHVEVKRHGEFQMGKRSICSGRSGIKFINRNGARGMASSCKGRHVMGLLAVIPKPTPSPTTSTRPVLN